MADHDVDGDLDYCYLVTTGRRSGEPREIEIWFGLEGDNVYLLAGGGERAHWVRNIRHDPAVRIRLGGATFAGRARIVAPGSDEDGRARALLVGKYGPRYAGSLADWGRTALPVAVELGARLDG